MSPGLGTAMGSVLAEAVRHPLKLSMDQASFPRFAWTPFAQAAAPEAEGRSSRGFGESAFGSGDASGSGASAPSSAVAGASPASRISSGAAPIRVLVVDDQPDVLATTVELFKIMGYEVHWASNGHDALQILESTPDVQVLFSDVIMPGMNGVKLATQARKLIPGIQIILASGFQASAMDPQDVDIRNFHFLSKPFRMADIARLLRQ